MAGMKRSHPDHDAAEAQAHRASKRIKSSSLHEHVLALIRYLQANRPDDYPKFLYDCDLLYKSKYSRSRRGSRSANGSGKSRPGTPGRPGTPARPGSPGPFTGVVHPGTPGHPAMPARPGTPMRPGTPVQHAHAVAPTYPILSSQDAGRTPPGTPVRPYTPVHPGSPSHAPRPGTPRLRSSPAPAPLNHPHRTLPLRSSTPVPFIGGQAPNLSSRGDLPLPPPASGARTVTPHESAAPHVPVRGHPRYVPEQEDYLPNNKSIDIQRRYAAWDRSLNDPDSSLGHPLTSELFDVEKDAIRFLEIAYLSKNVEEQGCILTEGYGPGKVQVVYLFAEMFFLDRERLANIKSKVLILVPDGACQSWLDHCNQIDRKIPFYVLNSSIDIKDTIKYLGVAPKGRSAGWNGIIVMTISVFAQLLTHRESTGTVNRELVDPGPDLIFFDEGHRLRLLDPYVRRMLRRVATSRRVAITAAPLANNLYDYWVMADWAAPDLLGTVDEFSEVHVWPIVNGHRVGRSAQDLHVGRRAAWLLWNRMMPLAVPIHLSPELPTSTRYAVISVHLEPIQAKCYVEAARVVHDAVDRGHLDRFIAAHVLQVAASHSFSLLKGVLASLDGVTFRTRERLAIFEQMKTARDVFEKIRVRTTSILEQHPDRLDRYPSSKLRVVCKLLDVCLGRGERMVVFTASPEVQKGIYAGLKDYLKGSHDDVIFIYDPSGYLTENPHDELLRWSASRNGSVIVAPVGTMSDCVEESGWSFHRASRVVLVDCCWNGTDNLQGLMRALPSSTTDAPPLHVYSLVAAATCERVFAGITTNSYPDPGPPNFLINREVGPEVYRPLDAHSKWNYDDRPMVEPKIVAEHSSVNDILRADDAEGGALSQLSILRFSNGRGNVVYEIDVPAPGKLSSAAYLLTRSLHTMSPEDIALAQQEYRSAMDSYKAVAGRALWKGLEERPDRASNMNGPGYINMLDRQASILPANADDFELGLQNNLFWAMRTHFDLFSRLYARDDGQHGNAQNERRQSLPANGPPRLRAAQDDNAASSHSRANGLERNDGRALGKTAHAMPRGGASVNGRQ
jgi:hypothetical protein